MQAQTLKPFANAHTPQRYAVSIAFVALIHAGLLYVLWNMGVIDQIIHPKPPDPFHVSIYEPPKPPPQPIPEKPRIAKPQPFVPKPDDPVPQDDNTGQQHTITATNQMPTPHGITSDVHGVMNTHTIPPYPPISVRLNETGSVTLEVHISEDGVVTDAVIVRSSGHERLDLAAVAWVKSHWRYQAAMQDGRPVASTASAVVKFELR